MGTFLGRFRKVTTNKLVVKNNLLVGNTSIFSQQGSTYYVDSGSGSDSNSGSSWSQALATLDAAINKCTANQGDIILLAPGHSESYTTTGAKATFDIAGVTVVSMGEGADRATFNFGHTGATFTISAASIKLVGLLFVTAVDSVVTYGSISGADCQLINCEFRDVTDKEVISDFTITGDRFVAIGCFKNGYTSGDANARVFSMNGVDNALIKNCLFMTKVTTGVINFVTTACTNIVVKDCVFYVNSTSLTKNIVDTITGSGWLAIGCSDLSGGANFSGGSGAALAYDDASAIATAVTAIQTDLGDPSARTNLQTILAILGNPDVAGATLWSALIGSNTTYDSRKGIKVTRAKGTVFTGSQVPIFTIAGGRVEITHIKGEVEDAAIDSESADVKFVFNPTVGADSDMCAVGALDSAPVGTTFSITGTPSDALTFDTGIVPCMAKSMELAEGTIEIVSEADNDAGGATGSFEIWYKPLDSGATVTAVAL